MQPEPLCLIATCDLVAVVRGRAVPASQLASHLATGVGWVPANLSLSPFGGIVNPNPFGSLGDLRLLPDLSSRCHVELGDSTPLDLVLGDLHELDGTPWVACPRAFLRNALADLERETGLLMQSSFEQEFQMPTDVRTAPFSLPSLRKLEPFASKLFAALAAAGLEPECFVPEYAADQYEIPIAPAIGVAAADRAIVLRELARELARSENRAITFTPITHPDGGGNGTHIHLSLIDATGQSKMGTPTELSKLAGAFAAGVLRHAPALVALTAPTPASFVRLQPHRWSTGIACLADGNREAMLRMPTPISIGGRPAEPQTRLEYRAADATACPYLALGAIVHAGLAGIRDELPTPAILHVEADVLDDAERSQFEATRLPTSLGEALDALETDPIARHWLPPLLLEAYLGVKRFEVAEAARDADAVATCARYAAHY